MTYSSEPPTDHANSLQTRLDEITTNTRALVQPERLAITDAWIAELFTTGIEDRVLGVGPKRRSFLSLTARPARPFARRICLPLVRWY